MVPAVVIDWGIYGTSESHVWLWLSHFDNFVDHVVERLGDALGKVGKFAGLTNGVRLSRDGNFGWVMWDNL